MAKCFGSLLAAALLAGCGNDIQSGGGTELPSPISFSIVAVSGGQVVDPSKTAKVVARQWRLWGVQSQANDTTSLESRGLLTDSAGVITLPPDAGTFLVEAWTSGSNHTPPESLDVRVRIPTASLPDPKKCFTTLSKSTHPTTVPGCTDGISQSPSTQASSIPSQAPDVVTMVSIPGNPIHQFRILGNLGDTLVMGESRLWRMTDNITFRGILKQGSLVTSDLPTLNSRDSFIVETWMTAGSAPARIATNSAKSQLISQGFQDCLLRISDPLPETITLHACPLPPPNLSGGKIAPDAWGALEYWPKD